MKQVKNFLNYAYKMLPLNIAIEADTAAFNQVMLTDIKNGWAIAGTALILLVVYLWVRRWIIDFQSKMNNDEFKE